MPVPLGPFLDWDDDALLRLATPTPEEIEAALAQATPEMRPFIEARLKPVESDLTSGPQT